VGIYKCSIAPGEPSGIEYSKGRRNAESIRNIGARRTGVEPLLVEQ